MTPFYRPGRRGPRELGLARASSPLPPFPVVAKPPPARGEMLLLDWMLAFISHVAWLGSKVSPFEQILPWPRFTGPLRKG